MKNNKPGGPCNVLKKNIAYFWTQFQSQVVGPSYSGRENPGSRWFLAMGFPGKWSTNESFFLWWKKYIFGVRKNLTIWLFNIANCKIPTINGAF